MQLRPLKWGNALQSIARGQFIGRVPTVHVLRRAGPMTSIGRNKTYKYWLGVSWLVGSASSEKGQRR